ncbi:MAG: SCO family protein [Pedosphaera sp.]|nr:SCO family protein [Pedosphaera sp.]
MDPTTERLSRTIWVGVGLLIVILCLTFVLSRLQSPPRPAAQLPILGQVADFSLTNQDGRAVTLTDLRGHAWAADIIFTRCPGPCPRMTRQMASLQAALPKESGAKLVTLTTDPEFDSPGVLKKYPERLGLNASDRWIFLTGAKKEIAGLAIGSLKLTAIEQPADQRTNEADLFIHSTIFVVVDKQARLRAVFETDGDGITWTNVQPAIIATLQQLERER